MQSRIFVTTQGCTDRETTQALMHEATAPLDALYDQGAIAGYKALVLVVDDDYADQDIERDLIVAETGGTLPALYLNVTYKLDGAPPDDGALAPVLARYAFRHLLTESDSP